MHLLVVYGVGSVGIVVCPLEHIGDASVWPDSLAAIVCRHFKICTHRLSFVISALNVYLCKVYKLESDENGQPTEKGLATLREAILSTFETVRRCNPHARILWIFGMYSANENLSKAVRDAIDLFGDENVDFLRVPTMRAEMKGAHGHPGPQSHREVADAILAYLAEKPLARRER